MTEYSLDTSGLIDGLERFYPEAHFPKLWEKIDELIADGRLYMSEEAWDEARAVDALAKDWCDEPGKNRKNCVVPTDSAIGKVVGLITKDYPTWSKQGQKNGADPFVIAVAEVRSAKVISGETNGGPSKPKIPYVCTQRQIECGKFIEIIKDEKWVIG